MKIYYTDTLVIGGGLAGLRVAIATQQAGHKTTVKTTFELFSFCSLSITSLL